VRLPVVAASARWVRTLGFRRPSPGPRSPHRVGRLVGILAIALVSIAGLAQIRTETGPESFVPAQDDSLSALHDSAKSFGGDPIIVLAESTKPRALLDADQLPRLFALEGRLSRLNDVAVVYGPATVLNQIAGSARQLVATLSGRRDAVAVEAQQAAKADGASRGEVAEAQKQAVAKFDDRYGALLVRGLPSGLPTLRNQGFVSKVIFDESGEPRAQWKFVVPKPGTVSLLVRPREGLDQTRTEDLVREVTATVQKAGLDTSRVTVTGVPAVTAGLGSQIRHELPLLGALAVLLIAACYWLVPWIQPRRYRLLPLAITLGSTLIVLSLFGWLNHPLSLGVIAFLPILVGIASDYPAYLSHPGRRRPVIVAALASAAAFASLAISPVPFVRDLGLALALGLLIALTLALTFGPQHHPTESLPAHVPSPEELLAEQTREWGMPHRLGALLAAIAVACIGWLALPNLQIEAQPDKLAQGVSAMDGIRHAQDVLGGSGEVQVVLRGPDVTAPEALAWMTKVEDVIAVRYGDKVRPIVSPPSLLSFLGTSPSPGEIAAGLDLLPRYLGGAVLRDDHRRATMSYLLGLQDLRAQGKVLDGVRSDLPAPPKGFDVELVGLPVVAARGYDQISGSVYLSNTIGIGVAGLVLLIGMRRRGVAGRAVLAASLATGWGLVVLSALSVPLTPLTLAIGSMTTATACEFTVMLAASREARGSSWYRTVVAAALAAGLGFAALSASDLDMVRQFGLVLAGTVALSFAAAQLVTKLLPERPAGTPIAPTAPIVAGRATRQKVDA
jgi:predicted RND superfamily exporter protein